MVVKISSFFGTTEGLRTLRGYRLPASKEIYADIGPRDIARMTVKSTVLIPKVLWRCSRLHKRWPWDGFDAQLERPLCDIRQEFGIRVATHHQKE